MAKYGKYKSIQELLEAKQGGIIVIDTLKGVVENIQMLRRELYKPNRERRLDSFGIRRELRDNLVGLNKVIKQLKRNKNLN